jgi:hypothetical protein
MAITANSTVTQLVDKIQTPEHILLLFKWFFILVLLFTIIKMLNYSLSPSLTTKKAEDEKRDTAMKDEVSEEHEPTQMITKTNTNYKEVVSSDDFKDQFKSELKKLEDLFSKIERNVRNVQSSSEQLKDNYDLDQILKLIKAYKES